MTGVGLDTSQSVHGTCCHVKSSCVTRCSKPLMKQQAESGLVEACDNWQPSFLPLRSYTPPTVCNKVLLTLHCCYPPVLR